MQLDLIDDIIIKEFFDHVSRKRVSGPFSDLVDPPSYNCPGYMNSYKNALEFCWKTHGEVKQEMPKEICHEIAEFIVGYQREYNDAKQRGEVPMMEGKCPMSFTGYRYIALKAVQATNDCMQNIFAWAYLVLCWNLMARSDNVGSLMLEHIGWVDDALTVTFVRMKGDQIGAKMMPRKVYANPVQPEICPVLALAVYMFTLGIRPPGAKKLLFCNTGASARFSKWLKNFLAVAEISAELAIMCIFIHDIGTHSFRKGITTFLCGMISGPSAVHIYLRAGWSLGVQKRYIWASQGGDELCGRAATGLCITLPQFASLPPHRNPKDGPMFTEAEWEDVYPGFAELPQVTKTVLPFLAASIFYHWKWLDEMLASNHPLRATRIWTHPRVDMLRRTIHVGEFYNDITGLAASGKRISAILTN